LYARCENLSGPLRIAPLGPAKWKLRFISDKAPTLRRGEPIHNQLQTNRELAGGTEKILWEALEKDRARGLNELHIEGRLIETTASRRERDPRLRTKALARYGHKCLVCKLDFVREYGPEFADCMEIHHLELISQRNPSGSFTQVDDVIVVCPNCHRALHKMEDPADWKQLRRQVNFA
jgi:5-methylcytosine-specific restriction endonuclease McrA